MAEFGNRGFYGEGKRTELVNLAHRVGADLMTDFGNCGVCRHDREAELADGKLATGPCPEKVPTTKLVKDVDSSGKLAVRENHTTLSTADCDGNARLLGNLQSFGYDGHARLPRELQSFVSPVDALAGYDGTTLVLRNVDVRCSLDRLMAEWPPDGSYDFICRPYSVKQRRPTRYAFVNFPRLSDAREFMERCNGQLLPDIAMALPLDIHMARVQGLQANLRLHSGSLHLPDAYLPKVFCCAQPLDVKAILARIANA